MKSADWRGDPSSALLDLPFDLSQVMFIATANALEPIPAPLRNRMETLELSGYWEEAKKTLRESREHDPELRFVYGKLQAEVYFPSR